jgi:hypothetical protein
MKPEPRSPADTYGPALAAALRDFQQLEPLVASWKADVSYQDGIFHVPFFGTTYQVTWPAGEVYQEPPGVPHAPGGHADFARAPGGHADYARAVHADFAPAAPITTCIVLLHYLIYADATPVQGDWIAFRELPDGMMYDSAFQGRGPLALLRAFGHDVAGLCRVARVLGGTKLDFGDAAYCFWAFPRLPLAVVLHEGDDEFPPALSLLYDRAAGHYLPTEDLASIGGMLTGRLLRARSQAPVQGEEEHALEHC